LGEKGTKLEETKKRKLGVFRLLGFESEGTTQEKESPKKEAEFA